ncbi:MAG: ABC transporter permease [Bacillota bacterium]|nr:ABC transporter permease [Bacillota bacterium]
MSTFINVLRNNYFRMLEKKNYFIIMLVVTVITIMLAVYFTAKLEVKGNVALVSTSQNLKFTSSKYIKISLLDKVPPKSQLIMNKYDAVVIDEGNGKFSIQSIKNKDFSQKILEAVTGNGKLSFRNETKRGAGSNIIGYLIMFIFLQGMMYMTLYSEDKENRAFKRIGTSPVSLTAYLISHCVFDFILSIIPTFTVLVVCKELFKINIGFGYPQYLFLLGILTLISTAFALFMSSIFDKSDNYLMMGQMIAILTTILAGSFYSFENNNSIMKAIINILPQKSYLNLVRGLEQGKTMVNFMPELAYLTVLTVMLFSAGTIICRRKLKHGSC